MNRTFRGPISACLGLLLLAGVAASDAMAGTYTVASCRAPISGAAPTSDASGGWRHESNPASNANLTFSDRCQLGDHLDVRVGGLPAFSPGYVYSQATFRPPVDTRIRAFSLHYEGYAVPSAASKTGFVVVESDADRYAAHPGSGDVPARTLTAKNIDASYLVLHAGCQSGNVLCGSPVAGGDAWARMLHSEITLADEFTPTGTVFGPGTLDDVWSQPQTLTVDTEDRGGGVASVALRIGDDEQAAALVDDNGGRCRTHSTSGIYLHPRPCLLDPAAKDVAVDVPAVVDGTYPVDVVVRDAAGNARILPLGRKTFDSHPPVLDGQAAVAGTGREGDALTCVAPIIDGQDPIVTFAWVRANADGSSRSTIAGANGQTYVPSAADVGRKLLCLVAATDRGGTSVSESALTSGPFSEGRTVLGICDGMPSGPTDPCGDLDRDGIRNRDDDDADGDGVGRAADPDDLNPAATGRDTTTPSGTGSSTTTTVTNTTTTTETVRQTVTVPDGPAGQINGQLGGPGVVLTVRHETTSNRTLRVSYGRRVIIQGRLRAPDGRGVGGAKVEISTQDRASGSTSKVFGSVATEADGSYRFILPAGPSRTVRVGYRARFGDAAFARTANVVVLVRAGLQFKLNRKTLRNGRSVRYSGRLRGPRTGHRFVEVQVRSGKRWIVVCSVRTDAKGAYACAHRFSKTYRRTRYVFRARVRRQATLPYEPVVSARRALVVRP